MKGATILDLPYCLEYAGVLVYRSTPSIPYSSPILPPVPVYDTPNFTFEKKYRQIALIMERGEMHTVGSGEWGVGSGWHCAQLRCAPTDHVQAGWTSDWNSNLFISGF
jgi:hypothetical protein